MYELYLCGKKSQRTGRFVGQGAGQFAFINSRFAFLFSEMMSCDGVEIQKLKFPGISFNHNESLVFAQRVRFTRVAKVRLKPRSHRRRKQFYKKRNVFRSLTVQTLPQTHPICSE